MRSHLYHESLLGEKGGWTGIRKERKKLWVEKGLTGVEDVPPIEDFSQVPVNEPEPKREFVPDTEELAVTLRFTVPKGMREAAVKLFETMTLTLDFGSKEPKIRDENYNVWDMDTDAADAVEQTQETEQPEVQAAPVHAAEPQPASENGWEAVFEGAQGNLPYVLLTPEAGNLLQNFGIYLIDGMPTHEVKPVQKPVEATCEPVASKPAEEEEQDDEEMRNPIKSDVKPRFMVVAPYDYTVMNRVDKTYPEKIRKAWAAKEIDFCYFPVDPFHYREPKRHATQIAVEACLENNIPFSIETRREVPDWCVQALARNKYSNVRVHLNTLDERKWKLQYPEASKPKELLETIIKCFNGGAYVILRIAPIIPALVEPIDVFQTVDAVKNWVESVEVTFASFNEAELDMLKEQIPERYEAIMAYYRNVNGRWYARDEYRKEFLAKLNAFTNGWKIKMKVLNEITADTENNVSLLNI
jgi:DNA repair photolyase